MVLVCARPEDAATQTWPRWSAGLRPQERRRYSNMETVVDQGISRSAHPKGRSDSKMDGVGPQRHDEPRDANMDALNIGARNSNMKAGSARAVAP